MPSLDRARRWGGALLALVAFGGGMAQASPRTHCRADETPFFSCVAGRKTVSLCGGASGGHLSTLTYRYGALGKVELELSAVSPVGPHFLATVEPVAPGASIRQVWFVRGDLHYLMHACAGGECPYGGGLAVTRGTRLLSNARCEPGPDAMARFAPELVEFGDGEEASRSHTPLLEISAFGHPIDRLYPLPASLFP